MLGRKLTNPPTHNSPRTKSPCQSESQHKFTVCINNKFKNRKLSFSNKMTQLRPRVAPLDPAIRTRSMDAFKYAFLPQTFQPGLVKLPREVVERLSRLTPSNVASTVSSNTVQRHSALHAHFLHFWLHLLHFAPSSSLLITVTMFMSISSAIYFGEPCYIFIQIQTNNATDETSPNWKPEVDLGR